MMDLEGKKNILILRLGKIGDIIIASAAFSAWKKIFPENKLYLVTLSKNKDVLRYNSDLDKILFIKNKLFLFLKLIGLRKVKFDLLLDLNDDPSTTSSLIRKFVNTKTTAGFKFSDRNVYDIFLEQPSKKETHIIQRLLQLMEQLNPKFRNVKLQPVLYLGKKEADEVKMELNSQRNNGKIIAINLSAGAPIRYWPEKNWINLISMICNESDIWNFIFLAEHRDEKIRDKIIEQVDKSRIIAVHHKTFQHYAAYIKNSDIVITADTAAVHISSSFNIPVVAIYPNYEWNFISWQPLSTHFISIKSKDENIFSVSVEEVYKSFIKLTSEL